MAEKDSIMVFINENEEIKRMRVSQGVSSYHINSIIDTFNKRGYKLVEVYEYEDELG